MNQLHEPSVGTFFNKVVRGEKSHWKIYRILIDLFLNRADTELDYRR